VWSQGPWSEAPWSGPLIPAPPPQQVLPPNLPAGSTTSYTYGIGVGSYPWSYGGWSGAVAPFAALPGGIVAAPNPLTGVVTISAWWPYAPTLQLVRVATDGVVTGVRGGYPATPSGPTLVNYATNPTGASTAGYTPGAGSPTITLVARTDNVGGNTVRATNASAGVSEVTVPQSLPAAPQVTVAFDMRVSARPTGGTVTLAWNDSTGAALTASAVTLTANQINACVGTWGRVVVAVTPPGNAATCPSLKVNMAGMPAGGTMDLDRWLIVQATSDGTYQDGDSLGGQWTGTAGLSTSVLAPVAVISDGECPLDVAVSYALYAPFLTGGYASSPTITLASNGQSWLTHPASPSAPVPCKPTETPQLTRKIPQGIFPIIGSKYPVVVSGAARLAPSGTLTLDTAAFTDRDTLLGLLSDGSPMLLRTPAEGGYGLGRWLAFADVVEDAKGRTFWNQTRFLVCQFQQVAAPAGPNTLVV
jgi:hypothetical protein